MRLTRSQRVFYSADQSTMKERIVMNSESLQTIFVKEYEDFFTKNDLVVSSPHIINRGNIGHLEEIKVKIAQKMPTKLYIGINKRKDDKIQFKTIVRFIHSEQRFEEKGLETEKNDEMIGKMKYIIKEKLLEHGYTQGIDISVLSENKRGTGIITLGTESLIISLIIYILSGKFLPEQMDDYDPFIKSREFKQIYMLAKDMMGAIAPVDKKHINTTALFTTGIHKGNIGVCFGSKEYLQSTYPKILQVEENICLEHLDMDPKQSIEYSILNFGTCFNEFYNTETYLNAQKEYEKILKYYKTNTVKPSLFIDMINLLHFKIFQTAKEAMLYPNDEYVVNNFFTHINRLGEYQTFTERYMDLYRDILSIFKENITFEDEKLGLLPISSAKPGGTFLCITKPQKSRETLEKMIDKLHQKGYTTANFQYLSREDGISEEHLKIEQHISKGQFSPHIQEGNAILEYGCGPDVGKKIIGNHRELLEKTENSIVFDNIDGKIYINNEITNHNEILSQSGTVEIIKVLFEHMGSYVNNTKLPSSSYSKNKNDMVGKIIGPLQELMQKKFNEKLDLECTGSIVDFDLKLTPNKLNLHLLKKIHQ